VITKRFCLIPSILSLLLVGTLKNVSAADTQGTAATKMPEYKQGSDAWMQKRYPEAESCLAKVLKAYPDDDSTLFFHATSLIHMDRNQEAASDLERLLKTKKSGWNLQRQELASCYAKTGQWKKAIPVYETLASMPNLSNKPIVISELANAYECAGLHSRAVKEFQEASRYGYEQPSKVILDAKALWKKGEKQQAFALLEDANKRGDQSLSVLHELAVLHMAAMHYDRAADIYGRCCKIADLCPDLLAEKGTGDTLAGRYAEAVQDISKALSMASAAPYADTTAWKICRAHDYVGLGQFDKAIKEYDALINSPNKLTMKGRPVSADYLRALRADVYVDAGDFSKAINDFNTLIANGPLRIRTSVLKKRRNAYLIMGNLEMACKDADAVIAENKRDEDGYFFRGLINLQRSKYTDAIADLSKAIELNAYEPDTLYRECRADAYLHAGDFKHAIEDYSAILKQDNTKPAFYLGMAICHQKIGQENLAKKDMSSARKLLAEKPIGSEKDKTKASGTDITERITTDSVLAHELKKRRESILKEASAAVTANV
jgi:tetratricopeptide (TPR) repeat protein